MEKWINRNEQMVCDCEMDLEWQTVLVRLIGDLSEGPWVCALGPTSMARGERLESLVGEGGQLVGWTCWIRPSE